MSAQIKSVLLLFSWMIITDLAHAQNSFVDYQKSFSRVAKAFNNCEDHLKSVYRKRIGMACKTAVYQVV